MMGERIAGTGQGDDAARLYGENSATRLQNWHVMPPQLGFASADLGRFAITRMESDRYVFRVPSLRNVAVTPPYFHDGSAASLPEAVEIMARVQLGRELPGQDIDLIVKFLETLTGEYQGRPLADDKEPSAR
jgi:cytochrome c peroxidase